MDPAANYIPFRGKLLWTHSLIAITFFLYLMSIILEDGIVSMKQNPYIGASADTMVIIGGVHGELIRAGDYWRLIWSCYIHLGIFHWLSNCSGMYILGVMIEPDWGFWRTFLIYNISGFTGNLFSVAMNPYKISVGASGGILGLLGGLIPYHIEYWDSIMQPKITLSIAIATMICGLALGLMPDVDNYAHMGGMLSGMLVGFIFIKRNGLKRHNFTRIAKNKSKGLVEDNTFRTINQPTNVILKVNRSAEEERIDAISPYNQSDHGIDNTGMSSGRYDDPIIRLDEPFHRIHVSPSAVQGSVLHNKALYVNNRKMEPCPIPLPWCTRVLNMIKRNKKYQKKYKIPTRFCLREIDPDLIIIDKTSPEVYIIQTVAFISQGLFMSACTLYLLDSPIFDFFKKVSP